MKRWKQEEDGPQQQPKLFLDQVGEGKGHRCVFFPSSLFFKDEGTQQSKLFLDQMGVGKGHRRCVFFPFLHFFMFQLLPTTDLCLLPLTISVFLGGVCGEGEG